MVNLNQLLEAPEMTSGPANAEVCGGLSLPNMSILLKMMTKEKLIMVLIRVWAGHTIPNAIYQVMTS